MKINRFTTIALSFALAVMVQGCGDGSSGFLSGSDNLYDVMIGGKAGYINREGKIIINPQFDSANRFKEGLAQVTIGKKFGYIDKQGKFVWNPQ